MPARGSRLAPGPAPDHRVAPAAPAPPSALPHRSLSWPGKINRAACAPSPASSRAKPERSGGVDPGPIPCPPAGRGRTRRIPAAAHGRRQVAGAGGHHRIGAVHISEWVPETPASAALGGRSGMTRRLCGTEVTRRALTHRCRPQRPDGPGPRPLPGVIPGEAGAERRRRPGTHSVPAGRSRADPADSCSSTWPSTGRWRWRAPPDRSTSRNGFRRRPPRCARRPFRNDAAAVRPRGPKGSLRIDADPNGPTVLARAPSPASSRAKPERSGGADPGPIPCPSTGRGRTRRIPAAAHGRRQVAGADGRHRIGRHHGMGSGYARPAALGRRSGMTRRLCGTEVTRRALTHPCRPLRPGGPGPRPLPGVIPGEAGAKRRRRPGTHSVPSAGRGRGRARGRHPPTLPAIPMPCTTGNPSTPPAPRATMAAADGGRTWTAGRGTNGRRGTSSRCSSRSPFRRPVPPVSAGSGSGTAWCARAGGYRRTRPACSARRSGPGP